jgi:hypothetical protein
MKQGQKNKAPVVGTAFLNLAEYACVTDKKEFDINIPLTLSACVASETHPLLFVWLLLSLDTSLLCWLDIGFLTFENLLFL